MHSRSSGVDTRKARLIENVWSFLSAYVWASDGALMGQAAVVLLYDGGRWGTLWVQCFSDSRRDWLLAASATSPKSLLPLASFRARTQLHTKNSLRLSPFCLSLSHPSTNQPSTTTSLNPHKISVLGPQLPATLPFPTTRQSTSKFVH